MTGADLAGWLRHLADQVEPLSRVDGQTFDAGPCQLTVPNSSTLRSWKQRKGSLEPPGVSDASQRALREAVRDAFETEGETLLRRIRDAVETLASGGALHASLLRDLKNTTTSEPDSVSRALGPAVVVAGGETLLGRETRTGEAFVSCPADLRLNAEQLANLEMGKGIPEHFAGNVTAAFVAKYLGDPDDKRTVANWRKGLGTAVIRTWDSKHRKDYLAERGEDTADQSEDPVDRECRLAKVREQLEADQIAAYEAEQERLWNERQQRAH